MQPRREIVGDGKFTELSHEPAPYFCLAQAHDRFGEQSTRVSDTSTLHGELKPA